jgi:putative ABC transport system permease protein
VSGFIKPSWRKVFSDLWGNKIRTALVVASIGVGVFAVGTIAGAYYIIPGDMNRAFESANPANIQLYTAPFDQDLLDVVARVEGVEAVEGRRNVSVRMQTGPQSWTAFDLIAPSNFSAERIDLQRPVGGADVPGKEQVILEQKTAEKYNLQPGDRLNIELNSGTKRSLLVVGVSQDLTSGIGGMFNNTRGYVHEDSLEWLNEAPSFTQLLVTVKDRPNDSAYIQQVTDRVTAKVEKSGRMVYQIRQAERNKHPMDSILQALLRILLILGVLIVFLSGSLISNTLAALLTQHLPQIGIMKLVGAKRWQIIRMYYILILSFGALALMAAVPAGSWAAFALSSYAGGLIGFPVYGYRVIPQALLIQIAIGLAVPLIAGSQPVLSGVGVTVKKAISGANMTENQTAKKGFFDRWLAGLRGLSRPALVSVRNTFRRKGRLALTLLTLTLGGAIFISVFNVQVSLNQKIEQITKYFGADINLDFSRTYPLAQVENAARGVEGIAAIEPWAITQAEILGADNKAEENLTLLAPPAGSQLVTPILLTGRWILPGDEAAIAINEAFLRKYPDINVGDSLRLKVGDRKANWQIVGIFQFTGVDNIIAYANYEHLSRVLNQPGRTSTYRLVMYDHTAAAQTALSEKLDLHLRTQGFQVSNVEAGGDFTRSMTEYISILTAFLIIMALLTAVVGSIGMAGTLSMNVMERTREIGVLRAIGAHDGVILRLVLLEGLLIGAISFVLGGLLSFPITTVLAEVVSQAVFNSPANFAFTAQGFGIWLLLVLMLSIVASLIPARSAAGMTIREVLAYE